MQRAGTMLPRGGVQDFQQQLLFGVSSSDDLIETPTIQPAVDSAAIDPDRAQQFDLLERTSSERQTRPDRRGGRRSPAQRRALREAYRMRGQRTRLDKVRHGRRICAELVAMLHESR